MTRGRQQQVQTSSKKLFDVSDFHSLDLLFDLIKERLTVQFDQADKLDTKASTTMTSATAIIGAALTLQAVLPTLLHSFSDISVNTFLPLLPLSLLALTYLITMAFSTLAFWIRTYKLTPDPVGLYRNYLYEDEKETKAYVMRSMVDDYSKNEKELDKKVFWNKVAFTALLTEIIFFLVFLLFHAIH